MNRIAIVSGGSGLVGTQLMHQLFQQEAYDYVIAVGRRELTMKHAKLVQVIVDFDRLEAVDLEERLRDKDIGGANRTLINLLQKGGYVMHAYCALGTTIKAAGSKEAFNKIDHDYVIGFANWVHRLRASKFLYVSAIGASANSPIFYNKVKGQVEDDLKKIPFEYLGIFQPSVLMGNRKESRLGEDVGKVVMRAVAAVGIYRKYKPIYDYQVAKALVHFAMENREKPVETISSIEMHQLKL